VRGWADDDLKASMVGGARREGEARLEARTEALVESDGSLKTPSVSKVRQWPGVHM
jgi:hypothetical protein